MKNPIIKTEPLGFPWQTSDPFLFCVHHRDFYPAGDADFAPDPSLLRGRNIGNDFTIKDGWRMYHGSKVPGFPVHPHRGFETITINKQGFVDHADSAGGLGRFGKGDVQWMTAGKGILHSEMFPLLNPDKENTMEIFQIWLNLPKAKKFVDAHFKMLWDEKVPKVTVEDSNGKNVVVEVVAGAFKDTLPPDPTPESWASVTDNEVAVWTIQMEANATLKLPLASKEATRTLYFYEGGEFKINDENLPINHSATLDAAAETILIAGSKPVNLLILQGRPINEPVVQYGPFVMNTEADIRQAYNDYQTTQFGGWPWDSESPVHKEYNQRFAKYSDGRLEYPENEKFG